MFVGVFYIRQFLREMVKPLQGRESKYIENSLVLLLKNREEEYPFEKIPKREFVSILL